MEEDCTLRRGPRHRSKRRVVGSALQLVSKPSWVWEPEMATPPRHRMSSKIDGVAAQEAAMIKAKKLGGEKRRRFNHPPELIGTNGTLMRWTRTHEMPSSLESVVICEREGLIVLSIMRYCKLWKREWKLERVPTRS